MMKYDDKNNHTPFARVMQDGPETPSAEELKPEVFTGTLDRVS